MKSISVSALAFSLAASLALVSLTSSRSARADIPPPNTSGCSGKKAGDACTDDDKKSGTCTSATRSRPNLARTDGGPATIDQQYLACTASTSSTQSTAAPSSSVPTSGAPEKKSGCGVAPSSPADGALVFASVLGVIALRSRKRRD